jgi:hypothetical protein
MHEEDSGLPRASLALGIVKTLVTMAISRDLKYAVRQLTRSPGFATIVVLSVGIAVGANAAIFRLVDAVRPAEPLALGD